VKQDGDSPPSSNGLSVTSRGDGGGGGGGGGGGTHVAAVAPSPRRSDDSQAMPDAVLPPNAVHFGGMFAQKQPSVAPATSAVIRTPTAVELPSAVQPAPPATPVGVGSSTEGAHQVHTEAKSQDDRKWTRSDDRQLLLAVREAMQRGDDVGSATWYACACVGKARRLSRPYLITASRRMCPSLPSFRHRSIAAIRLGRSPESVQHRYQQLLVLMAQ